jgi:hypothetical protein
VFWAIMIMLGLSSLSTFTIEKFFIEKKDQLIRKKEKVGKKILFIALSTGLFITYFTWASYEQTAINNCPESFELNDKIQRCGFHGASKKNPNPHHQTMIILGDNSTLHYEKILSEKITQKNFNVLFLSDGHCPPYMGLYEGSNERDQNNCKLNQEKIIQIIKENKNISIILFLTRGPLYITRYGIHPKENKYLDLIYENQDNFKDFPHLTFQEAVYKTISTLKESQKKIFFLLDPPEFPFDGTLSLKRPFINETKWDGSIPLEDYFWRHKKYLKAMEDLRGHLSDESVRFISTQHLFCDDNKCYCLKNNLLLCGENGHINSVGADFLAPYILREIDWGP